MRQATYASYVVHLHLRNCRRRLLGFGQAEGAVQLFLRSRAPLSATCSCCAGQLAGTLLTSLIQLLDSCPGSAGAPHEQPVPKLAHCAVHRGLLRLLGEQEGI